MDSSLHFVDAVEPAHFRAMSHIHALGWRDTYQGYVPADYLAHEITDDRWTDVFRENHERGIFHGLLLYQEAEPVSCINYGPARVGEQSGGGMIVKFDSEAYADWGEIISFYTHPAHRGKGYGGLLFDETCCRLKAMGFEQAFVFVLRENTKARNFYAAHGFSWDGSTQEIPFPPDTICVDLRYVKTL